MESYKNLLPYGLVKLFAESIIDGNEIYCRLSNTNQLPNINLNIPEAKMVAGEKINIIEEWVIIFVLFIIHCVYIISVLEIVCMLGFIR